MKMHAGSEKNDLGGSCGFEKVQKTGLATLDCKHYNAPAVRYERYAIQGVDGVLSWSV